MAETFPDFPTVSIRGRGLIGRAWDASCLRCRRFLHERHVRKNVADLQIRDERLLRDIGVEYDELEQVVRTGRRRHDRDRPI